MKKVLVIIAAALLCNAAFAQSISFSDGSVESGASRDYSVIDFGSVGNIGFGFHVMTGGDDDFLAATPNFGKNREFFLNLSGVTFRPVKYASLSLGVDLNWDNYRLQDQYFWLPDNAGNVTIAKLEDHPEYTRIKKSVLRSFGFDFPLMLNLHLGPVLLSGGVVGEFNFAGRTRFVAYDNSSNKVKDGAMRVKDIQSVPFTYSYRVSAMVYGVGLYAKYSPASQFIAGSGPQFSYYTVGLIL